MVENIFVSYSRSDADLVVKLATELRQHGANLWLDQLDIPFGTIWDVEIERALEACTCLLFIVSKSSVTSNNVLNEVYYALEDSKRVLPVKINDCKIPFRIKRLQYIDLSSNYDNGFLQLLKTLNLETKPESTQVKEPDDEEQMWGIAKSGNTKHSIGKYLNRFPEGKFKKEALGIIEKITQYEIEEENRKTEQVLWADTVSKNTIPSYQNYLSNTKLTDHVDEANSAIEKLRKKIEEDSEDQLWQRVEKKNTSKEYQRYLMHYPSGRYAMLAKTKITSLENSYEEALWTDAVSDNTIPSYQDYLSNTKLAAHVDEANSAIEKLRKKIEEDAEDQLWQRAEKENTIYEYENYLTHHPSGRYAGLAKTKIESLENSNEEALWNEAKNSNTLFSFQHYIKNTKVKKYEKEASSSIEHLQKIAKEEMFWLKVKKENTASSFREYLKTYKNGKHIDEALLAIKKFEQEESKIDFIIQPSNASAPVQPPVTEVVETGEAEQTVQQWFQVVKESKINSGHILLIISVASIAVLLVFYFSNKNPDVASSSELSSDTSMVVRPDTLVVAIKNDSGTSVVATHDRPANALDSNTSKTKDVKLKADDAVAYYERGISKQDKDDDVGAIKDFTAAIKLKRDYADAYVYRGISKGALGDHAGEIKDYTNAIQLEPNDGVNYYLRARAKQINGDKAGACKDFKKACDLGDKDGCNEYKSTCK